jgi:hypothetical protein
VTRSGFGGYLSSYGYSWSISFVGDGVRGNVQELEIITGGSCSPASLPTGVSITVETVNENKALGVDTEITQLDVAASALVAEGQYTISVTNTASATTDTTTCIPWNADVATFSNAMKDLTTVDSVFVERYGSGDSASVFCLWIFIFNLF